MLNRATPLRSVDEIDAIANEVNQFRNMNSIEQFSENAPIIDIGSLQKAEEVIVQQRSSLKEEAKVELDSQVEVFFTKDRDLLNQYYILRYEAYRDEWGFETVSRTETEFDQQGRIIVALKDGKLVGGACLMFAEDCPYLSNEIPETRYNYKEVLKTFDERENLNYTEVSGVVVAKNHRDRSVTEKMFETIISESKKRNCNYIVGISLLAIAREYRIVFKKLNHQLTIVLNYPWKQKEVYNLLRMFPMCVKIL